MHVRFSDLAYDWLAAVLQADQMPGFRKYLLTNIDFSMDFTYSANL